jgi:prepilin-type N-terminal cleavage/methylation domain-containing protein
LRVTDPRARSGTWDIAKSDHTKVTHKSHTAQRRRGFTIIEIVGVLVLLSIIAVGAVSILPASNVSLAGEANRLSSHLRYAQIRAQADIYQWHLVFIDDTTYEIGYWKIPGEGFKRQIVPGAGGGALQGTMTDGVTATVETVGTVGTDRIQFDSWGRPVPDETGAVPWITLAQEGQPDRDITIRAGTGLIP